MRTDARLFDFAAGGLAVALVICEVIRLVAIRGVTGHFTMLMSVLGGVAFIVILLAAAVGLFLHRRVGWLLGVFGMIVTASHGVIVRVGGSHVGIVYVLAAPVLFVLLAKDLYSYRSQEPSGSPPARGWVSRSRRRAT
jgi:hypothetical protein